MTSSLWDERFRGGGHVYGVDPNDFLREHATRIPPGPVVCLAEGGGRNAVFLAERGFEVTAVDFSPEGLRLARELAWARGVRVEAVEADLATYDLGVARWNGIVAIWAHVAPATRARLYARVAAALRPGGCLILEAYRPEQLQHGTGGPKDPAMLPTLAELRGHLAGLDLLIARDATREIHEGPLHGGTSATVQIVAVKPV